MAEWIVTIFLALSIFAYVMTGGADFGVGVLELFAPKSQRRHIRRLGERAIAPIWEANHIWLIVALVILFAAFPAVYARLSTTLQFPLLLMLAGIIIRGTAFTFRYYDVGDDAFSERLWTWLFRIGSLMVPITFGHIIAATARGRLLSTPQDVWTTYLAPWLGFFPLAVGFFVACLFAWIAAVFLVGEIEEPCHDLADAAELWLGRVQNWTMLLMLAGILVSGAAIAERVPWIMEVTQEVWRLLIVGAATLGLVGVWRSTTAGAFWRARLLAGFVVGAILLGFWGSLRPIAFQFRDAPPLYLHDALAPAAAVNAVAGTLLFASALILPGLGYLYWLFKSRAQS